MPTNLTEVDEFTADVTVPEDGDDRNAASVEVPFQALANRTKYAKARLDELKLKTRRVGCLLDVTGTSIADDGAATLQINRQTIDAGFETLDVDNVVASPGIALRGPQGEAAVGLYLVTLTAFVGVASTDNPSVAQIELSCGGETQLCRGVRHSADNLGGIAVTGSWICEMGGVGDNLVLFNRSGSALTFAAGSNVTVARISGGSSGW
jgi:hypothetical protein